MGAGLMLHGDTVAERRKHSSEAEIVDFHASQAL